MFFPSKSKKQRGETIVETLVAVSIITLSLAGIMTLLSKNVTTNQSNRNRVIAVNLAREGIEAVRFIRDTNWLIYSKNRRICWNYWPNPPAFSTCNENGATGQNNHKLSGLYLVDYDSATFNWKITQDSTPAINTDNQLYLNSSGIYTTTIGTNTPTIFMRQIEITYPDGGNTKAEDNRMLVKSIVQFGQEKVQLETILTDFLTRQGHTE